MRPVSRWTKILLALATAVASAVIPVTIGPVQQPVSHRLPGTEQRITILERDQAPAMAMPARSVVEKATAPVRKAVAQVAEQAPADVAVEDTSGWVASVDTLGSDDGAGYEEPAGNGPCPKAKTCTSNQVRPQRWKTAKDGSLTIKWRFNDQGRRNLRAPAGLLESAVRSGMAQWSKWNSNLHFVYDGTTTAAFGAKGKDGSCSDGVNTITWARFDSSIIAAVGTCIDPKTNTVRDADLALNVTQHWEDISGKPKSRHSFDIRSIVTHELGHVVSLLDLYSGDALRQTMMGNAEYGETRKRTLALGDIIGLQTAYPCGKGDTCPRKGIVDD